MLPIGPLMIEHRVIERIIRLMKNELETIRKKASPNLVFIEVAVDFIRTYADRCHHGKEEDILFRDLKKKPLSVPLRAMLDELTQDHVLGRNTVKKLVDAKNRFQSGDAKALADIATQTEFLVEFYPKHIDKEDNHFFRPCMDYFSEKEREAMIAEFYEFDRKLIHAKYKQLVENLEKGI